MQTVATGADLLLRTFLSKAGMTDGKRNHRWPLGAQVGLNNVPLPVVHVPPIFDGISTYDANADQPLRLPPHLLRAGANLHTAIHIHSHARCE